MSRGEATILYVDGGTTQTRVWVRRGDRVLTQGRAPVGARDTARDGSPARLAAAVGALVAEALSSEALSAADRPVIGVAAGMITSPQGLCEVPHVEAPAGAPELASGARSVPAGRIVDDVPFLFVPGVRSGPARCDRETIVGADVMRGEEVVALGLHALGLLPAGGTVLNLGSHWKAIHIDGAGRIAGSVSTLSGEMIHAVQSQTILASALPQERPSTLDAGWLAAGAEVFRQSGLARALYCVRLLEQRAEGGPAERQAFLFGAFMAADRTALLGDRPRAVAVVGGTALANAWADALARDGISATVIAEEQGERAFCAGCALVLEAAGALA